MTKLEIEQKISSLPTNTIISSKEININEDFNIYKKIITTFPCKLPQTFDGVKVWGNKLCNVYTQGNCGSCWAFASTATLADRFNIQSLGKLSLDLSATKMLLCNNVGVDMLEDKQKEEIENVNNFSCFGNTLNNACNYLYTYGTNTSSCINYNNFEGDYNSISDFKQITQLPLCSEISGASLDMCSNLIKLEKRFEVLGDPARFYRALKIYAIHGTKNSLENGSEEQIRFDIYKWGPVCSAFEVYEDFYTFNPKNSIYEWDGESKKISGHSIEIVGWGEENGKKYWQIKNSWGTEWGINGYFKMIRGTNNCKIEQNCIGMLPDFFYPDNYKNKQQIDYVITNLENLEKIDNTRNKLENDINITSGGIVNTTGYSRRVMRQYPWINMKNPVNLDNLPNWTNFIAGKDSKNQDLKSNDLKSKDIIKKNKPFYIYIFYGIIIILLLLLLFLKIFK